MQSQPHLGWERPWAVWVQSCRQAFLASAHTPKLGALAYQEGLAPQEVCTLCIVAILMSYIICTTGAVCFSLVSYASPCFKAKRCILPDGFRCYNIFVCCKLDGMQTVLTLYVD